MGRFKVIILIAVVVVLSAGTLAYACKSCGCRGNKAKTEAPAVQEAEAPKVVEMVGNKVCPVMKAEIMKEHAIYAEYKGKVYSFCCQGCIGEFKKDPEKYRKIVEEEMKKKDN